MIRVIIKNEKKIIPKLPDYIREILFELISEIILEGPIQSEWYNYSSLGKNKYHCHLARKWVACWEDRGYFSEQDLKGNYISYTLIEVYYVGSRENAPY